MYKNGCILCDVINSFQKTPNVGGPGRHHQFLTLANTKMGKEMELWQAERSLVAEPLRPRYKSKTTYNTQILYRAHEEMPM